MNVIPSVRALPARVVPLPGESLISLVRRTAAAMGYEGPHRLRALIVDVGKVQANVNVLRPAENQLRENLLSPGRARLCIGRNEDVAVAKDEIVPGTRVEVV